MVSTILCIISTMCADSYHFSGLYNLVTSSMAWPSHMVVPRDRERLVININHVRYPGHFPVSRISRMHAARFASSNYREVNVGSVGVNCSPLALCL